MIPKATILIENPIAVTSTSKHKTEAKAFVKFLRTAAGAEDLRAERLPAGRAERARKASTSRPDRSSSRSSTSAAGRRSRRSSSIRTRASWRRSRGRVAARRRRTAAAPGARRSLAPGLADRSEHALPERDRAAAARARWAGAAHGWDAVSSAAGGCRAEAHARASRSSVALVNAVAGTAIAWTLVRDRFVGQGFVNALIDLPFALPTIVAGLTLLALYGPKSPVGRQRRLHTLGDSCSRCSS